VSEVHDQLVGSLDTGVTVEALAKKYGISPISLNKYFSIMYGDTVHKYLQSYRMDHAAKLLSDTDKSIADIALDVGYENQGKFATLFKRIYGMSPLEYRRCKK
jgi:AraC-like DNA-binding protein